MIRRSTIHSMKPCFEFRVGSHSFYAGLEIHVVLWREGISLTFTARKIYNEYTSAWKKRAQEMVEKAKEKENGKC